MLKAGLMYLMRGWWPGRPPAEEEIYVDGAAGDRAYHRPDGKLTFGKVDSVGRSGNVTRDDIPSHLYSEDGIPTEVARFYENICPAGSTRLLKKGSSGSTRPTASTA